MSNRKSRQRVAGVPVSDIGRDRSDNLDSIGFRGVKNRAAADAVDRNSVDQVGMELVFPGANISREEAQRSARANSGKAQPSDLDSNSQPGIAWEQVYERLWEFKLRCRD